MVPITNLSVAVLIAATVRPKRSYAVFMIYIKPEDLGSRMPHRPSFRTAVLAKTTSMVATKVVATIVPGCQ